MNWLRSKIPAWLKSALVSMLVNKYTGLFLCWFFQNEIPHFGKKININSSRVSVSKAASIFWRLYERPEISFLKRHMTKDLDIIEFGGSIGVTACQTLDYVAEDSRYIVVEADPELCELLTANLKLNHAPERVQVLNKAISYQSDSEHRVLFSKSSSHLQGSTRPYAALDSLPKHDWLGPLEYFSVETTTLSTIIENYSIQDYVLISDIDLSVLSIFLEDIRSLDRCKMIFIELNEGCFESNEYTYQKIEDLICSHNFEVVDKYYNCYLFQKKNPPKPFSGINNRLAT